MEQERKRSNKKKPVTDNLCGLSEIQFKEIYKFLVLYSSIQNQSSGITQAILCLLLKHNSDWVYTDNDTSIYKMLWGSNEKNKIFRNSNDITKYLIPMKTAFEHKENLSDEIVLVDLSYDSNAKGELLDNLLTSREHELNIIFNINTDDINNLNILNPAVINLIEVDENNFFETFNHIKSGVNSFKKGNKPLVILNQVTGITSLESFENYLKENKIFSKKELDTIKEEALNDNPGSAEEFNAYELSGESDELLVILIGKSKLNDDVQKLYSDDLKFNLLTILNISDVNEGLICGSVNKCGKVLIIYDHKELEIISNRVLRMVIENCFENLDAPVRTLNSSDIKQIKNKIEELLSY
ncbi:MAG TPA: hypothetical protein VHP32_10815 [Ignavibacteria bacterium]|nr:hypothetical protein [Ignavibacteria bacterium]